jgi:protein TonB
MRPAGIDPFRSGPRWPGLVLVIGVHVAILIALLSYTPVREAIGLKPLMVEFITPPAPPPPEPPKEQPKPVEVKIVKRNPDPPKPQPVIAARTEAPAAVEVAQPEPPKPLPPIQAAPAAPPAPAAPATRVVVSGVEYIRKPEPVYPSIARRMGEQGTVSLRVIVGLTGQAESAVVQKTSGSPRLDEAARVAIMKALFKPHLVNGQPALASVIIPINFSLDS